MIAMKLCRVLTSLAVGSVTLLPTAGVAEPRSDGYRVGDRFPEVVLPSLADGAPLSLASFRGRKLVLHVWASW